MIAYLKIFFGWKGTWFWACRQMQEGKTVRRLRDSGVVRFSYDHGRRRIKAMIMWETSTEPKEWGISMEDIFATDFELQYVCKPLTEGPAKSQIKNYMPGEIYIGPAPTSKPENAYNHNMNIIDQIKEDKTILEDTIAKLIREFEDKHQVIEVIEVKVGRYDTGANWNNNGKSFCKLSINIKGIS